MAKKIGTCCKCGKKGRVYSRHNKKICYDCVPKKLCSVCKEEKEIATYIECKPVCRKCYRAPKRTCSVCGEKRAANKLDENKQPICIKCYKAPIEKCSICGEEKEVHTRNEIGPICTKCYKRPKRICSICGEKRVIGKLDENKQPVCRKCYEAPTEKCSICGEEKEVSKRDENKKPICKKCYKTPIEKCSICGEKRTVEKRDENNKPICEKCYKRPKRICSICYEKRRVEKLYNESPVCRKCHRKIRNQTDTKYRITNLLRKRLWEAFKNYSTIGKTMKSEEYGIDYEAIIKHLGPCPGERDQYHVDHIFPLSVFDFDNPIHIKAAFAPENHQWLKVIDNLCKGSKYNEKFFKEYVEKFAKC